MAVPWSTEQPLLAAFSFIGFVLAVVPLTWQLQAWNIGCILYGGWAGLLCLIQFINLMVWRSDAINKAPIWCDIAIRIVYIGQLGIVSAGLVIARRVSKISTNVEVFPNSGTSDRRRMIITDLAIGLSVPIAQLIIFYFVQGHRFDLYEGIGCVFVVPITIPAAFLRYAWPVVIGIVSAIYSGITLRVFYRRRTTFRAFLVKNYHITFHQYCRLVVIAIVEMALTTPLALYTLVSNYYFGPIYPWKGLADLHSGFGRVRQYPTAIWIAFPSVQINMEMERWFAIGCALVYFMLFGMTETARRHYVLWYNVVASRLHLPMIDDTPKFTSFGTASFWFASHDTDAYNMTAGSSTVLSVEDAGYPNKKMRMSDEEHGDIVDIVAPPEACYYPPQRDRKSKDGQLFV